MGSFLSCTKKDVTKIESEIASVNLQKLNTQIELLVTEVATLRNVVLGKSTTAVPLPPLVRNSPDENSSK